METQQLTLVYFSPTNTTRTILEEIAKGLGREMTTVIDMTPPQNRKKEVYKLTTGPVLMGAPVHAGRLPKDAADCFKRIQASGNPAILTVLYGNREFEDALLELKNIAIECGLRPVAAGAFIGEHSYSSKKYPIAQSRPDSADLKIAFSFGQQITDLIGKGEPQEKTGSIQVPGNFPYREGMGRGASPCIEVSEACDDCGICLSVCPKQAINAIDHYSVIAERCIFCCSCIKSCPLEARVIKEGPIHEKAKWLHENYSKRKEPELFFAG